MTVIEKVARAIAQEDGDVGLMWDYYVPHAKAALAALREPTAQMLEHGHYWNDMPGDCWRAMIDHILNQPEATMEVKIGDVVHVRAHVHGRATPKSDCWEVTTDYKRFNVHPDEIVHVEPRPLKVGDRVKYRVGGDELGGVVLARHNDFAWIEWLCGPNTERADSLTRID